MAEDVSTKRDPGEKPKGGPVMEEMVVSKRRALVRAYWGEIVFGISLSLYAVMAVLAHRYAYFDWDLKLARGIQAITLPGFTRLMVWVSALGSGWMPTAMVVTTGVALFVARFKKEALVCLSGAGIGAALNRLLKGVSGRPRPTGDLVQIMTEYRHESFPSGHVVFFITYFGFLLFLCYVLLERGVVRRVSITVLALLILMVGLSRVYMGAHWPSDVVGAYLAGGVWLMVMIEVYRRWKKRRSI